MVAFIAREYISVPAIAILDPMMDPVDIGVLKATTDATMITTRLMVFPTAWVTGLTYTYIHTFIHDSIENELIG